MYKSYKFRLYPDNEQKILIHKTFGSTRFIYNYFLDKCKDTKFTNAKDLCNEVKTLTNEYEWLKEVDSCAIRCTIFNLEDSFKNFFAKRCEYPKYKNKFSKQSYRTNCIRNAYKGKEYSNIELDLVNKTIKLPKLKEVSIRGYRNLTSIDGRIINATITRENTNKYYVSVLVEENKKEVKKEIPNSIVGIDLGVKDLVITSNGEKYQNNKYLLKKEKRLKMLQRKLSKKKINSNNYKKLKVKIARLHSKIKNSRKHNIIEIVNNLVNNYSIIVSESLSVKEMCQTNNKISRYLLDASFNMITNMISQKAKEKGKYYYKIDKYFPSSKMCSRCGNITQETNDLNIRKWICCKCNTVHDRDFNASINIMDKGLEIHYKMRYGV